MRWLVVVGVFLAVSSFTWAADTPYWSEEELNLIKSLSLAKLRELKPDASNRVSDDPKAAELGKKLFFDTRFSANGSVACASCHIPDHQFQDDLPLAHGVAEGTRRTMPLAGTSYHLFFFWDGRKDSQWSQALGPLENPLEHGVDRSMIVRLLAANYAAEYEALFGPLPDPATLPAHAAPTGTAEAIGAWEALSSDEQKAINLAFANMGKAIAAFERSIVPQPTRFDDYAAAVAADDVPAAEKLFSEQERQGLKLFLGNGFCVECHSGPLFTDMQFHNVGLPGQTVEKDSGRSSSVAEVRADPFNCYGEFSDAPKSACGPLNFMRRTGQDLIGAFKSPSLRGVSQRPPFMHGGEFATMHEVMVHYNDADPASFGKNELEPLRLTEEQLSDLEAFLLTLNVADPSSGVHAP